MSRRFVTIWFRHLTTDRMIIRRPELKDTPFVLASPERGRMMVRAASTVAEANGIEPGMVVADARAVFPSLEVIDDEPELANNVLNELAEWCIRYTPIAAVDPPNGLIIEATGCAHLWGGEVRYLQDIIIKLENSGYDIRAAIADTIGAAWAICRYGQKTPIVETGCQADALLPLPPAALRLEQDVLQRLQKLGLQQIRNFIGMPRSVLRRRFGQRLLDRIDHAIGPSNETITPIQPIEPYQERLPCMEPIVTATGIKIALKRLLETLCKRLGAEGKGLRAANFKCYRMDGILEQIDIVTTGPSCHSQHLYKLFELKVSTIEPALGIELFLLEAPHVEDMPTIQEALWNSAGNYLNTGIMELLDRLAGRAGMGAINRYFPDEHYWPERSVKTATSLMEKPQTAWRTDRLRPVLLLPKPEIIDVVSAPLPDYPPMLLRYKGKLHHIKKADGPERIEQEWWIEQGLHRDYYCVENEHGERYWIFRSGHYDGNKPQWFVHGFFA